MPDAPLPQPEDAGAAPTTGSVREVLVVFLLLGLVSFGGPAAHIACFREAFVVRRNWLGDARFAQLVALSQSLPGPASSKLGFTLGLYRAGYAGGLAAWIGFTLPTALIMVVLAAGAVGLAESAAGQALIHGLKLVAVVIVAQALIAMAANLTPDGPRRAIAFGSAALVLLAPLAPAPFLAMAIGAVAGLWLCPPQAGTLACPSDAIAGPVLPAIGLAAGALFCLLLAVALWPTGDDAGMLALWNAFYRAGALVFGGGHVVLPLLEQAVVAPGWVTPEVFLAGYGAAQAMPGPLFAIAAYLGFAPDNPVGGLAGAAIALVAIFLPGLLLQLALLPFWDRFTGLAGAQALLRGVNAAVVGILAATLITPVATSAIGTVGDLAATFLGIASLHTGRVPMIVVLIATLLAGMALYFLAI